MDAEPIDIILEALVTQIGAGVHFKVVHGRNANPPEADWPCVAVEFDESEERDQPISMGEMLVDAAINLIAYTKVPEDDRTGYKTAGSMLASAVRTIRGEDELGTKRDTLGGLAWGIAVKGLIPDEDSTPDKAKLVRRLIVMYRVRTEDPSQLLTDQPGEL